MQERALKETPKILKLCDFIGLQKKNQNKTKQTVKVKRSQLSHFLHFQQGTRKSSRIA